MSEKTTKLNLIEKFKAFILADEVDEPKGAEDLKSYALKDDPSVAIVVDANGNVSFSDGRDVIDGEYPLDGDLVCVITNGKAEIKEVEVKKQEQPVEPPLDASKQMQEDFEKQKAEFEKALDEAKNANAELSNQIANLQKQSEDFAVVKSDLEKQIADLTKENADLKSQLPSKVGEFVINETKKSEKPKEINWDFYAKK